MFRKQVLGVLSSYQWRLINPIIDGISMNVGLAGSVIEVLNKTFSRS